MNRNINIGVEKEIDYANACYEGMGLDPHLLTKILYYLKTGRIKRVLEFGSGSSTDFLLSVREKYQLDYTIDSFDHDERYSYNPNLLHEDFNLRIRELVQYDDKQFSKILSGEEMPLGATVPKSEYGNFRIKNVFYDIKDQDLTGTYDLVILDGPNGNGRSISFNYISKYVKKGSIIVIDDYHHYPFVENCQKLISTDIVRKVNLFDFHELHGYVILEVVE